MGRRLRLGMLGLALVLLSGCGLLSGGESPSPGPPEAPRGLDYQFQATERRLDFQFTEDGVLHLVQDVIVDAGADGGQELVVGHVAPMTLDIEDDTRYQVTPRFVDEQVMDVTDPANPVALGVERGPTRSSDGYRYLITAEGGWTPGRHLIRFSAEIHDVWRTMPDGVSRLVLPHLAIGASWYPYRDELAFTTITATAPIMCTDRRGSAELCNPTDPQVVGVPGEFPGLGSSGDEPRYYFVEPSGISVDAPGHDEVPLAFVQAVAPNPYGQATSTMDIEVAADGGYSVVHTMTQEMVLEGSVRFGMAMPNAVRLPDDPAHPLPGLLTSPVLDVVAEQDGEPVEVSDDSIGRRLDYQLPARELQAGDYSAVLRYRRPAASIAGAEGIDSYLQLPRDSEVTLSAPGEITQVRCGTRPGVFEACGTADGEGWRIEAGQFGTGDGPDPWSPQVVLVTWTAPDAQLAPPDISYS